MRYAVGCHPTKNAFDDWWELKRRTFGADEGVEPVSLATMEAWMKHTSRDVLTLQINQHSITHVTDAKTAVDAAPRSPPDMFDVKNDDRAARAGRAEVLRGPQRPGASGLIGTNLGSHLGSAPPRRLSRLRAQRSGRHREPRPAEPRW